MRDSWKQPTPLMQLLTIRSGFEGHFDNWCDSIISDGKFGERTRLFIKEIAELEKYLEKGEWFVSVTKEN